MSFRISEYAATPDPEHFDVRLCVSMYSCCREISSIGRHRKPFSLYSSLKKSNGLEGVANADLKDLPLQSLVCLNR